MILDFNIVSLLFIGYFVQFSYAGGGKKESVHVKIHVPEFIKHHHHTKVVFVHKPHHKPEVKKPLVVHHHHHHKHDHGHKHKHGHNHGHKHQHGHKHGHKHKHNLYHHHDEHPHHHHHHHKKHKYVTKEHHVDHFPVNRYRSFHKKNENYQSHSYGNPNAFVPLVKPNYYQLHSYKVREPGDEFTTSGYDLPPYPHLSSLIVNPEVEYVGQHESVDDDSSENISNDEGPADYASNEHYEHLREPLHEEGFYDYEEETRKRLVGPDGQVLVTKTVAVGDNNGQHFSQSTEVI